MVLDGQKVWTDGWNRRTDGRRQNNITPTSSGDKYFMINLEERIGPSLDQTCITKVDIECH